MTLRVLVDVTASITDLKRDPLATVHKGQGVAVDIEDLIAIDNRGSHPES